jgi:hypothetical protein
MIFRYTGLQGETERERRMESMLCWEAEESRTTTRTTTRTIKERRGNHLLVLVVVVVLVLDRG